MLWGKIQIENGIPSQLNRTSRMQQQIRLTFTLRVVSFIEIL